MKLTTARLKKLIKEELESVIREENMSEDLKGAIAELKNLMSRGTDGSKKPDTDMSMLLINSIMNFAADGRDDAEAAMLVTQGIKPKLHNLIDDIAQEMNPGMLSKIGSKIGSFFSEE
jgi:hypothetical protein